MTVTEQRDGPMRNDVKMGEAERYIEQMATLAVKLGAKLQPGHVVSISSDPG